MKTLAACAIALGLSACTISQHAGPINLAQAPIVLDHGNFKVVKTVRSMASTSVFFGLGDQTGLLDRLHADLIAQAELEDRPRALVNFGTETVTSGLWPVIYVKTLRGWATVIELKAEPAPAE